MFYIYKITNIINNKVYIGQTGNIKRRWSQHKSKARSKFPSLLINKKMKEYGINNFIFEIIDECDNVNIANDVEIFFIAYYKSNVCRYLALYGYNMTDGGEGSLRSTRSIETKNKISKSLKGKYIGELSHKFGVKLSESHKQKLSFKGKRHLDTTKEKLRQLNIGKNNPMYGKKLSKERKELLSISSLGDKNNMWNKPVPLNVREKQSISHRKNKTDYYHSEEKIAKIKAARQNQNMKYRIPSDIKSEIIKLFNSGNFTKKQLSEKFNIKTGTIRTIIKRSKNQ